MRDLEETSFYEEVATQTAYFAARPIIQRAFSLLEDNLPKQYAFHSIEHTKDVFKEAVLFACYDKRDAREQELIAIAAAYHDVGFIEGAEGHEQRGADAVGEEMERDGTYEESEIVLVRRMILDTHLNETHHGMKQKATTLLAGYLLDADLSNFGREDFFQRLVALADELGLKQAALASNTHTLMTRHRWKTKAANDLREAKKLENIAKLEKDFQIAPETP